MSSRVEVHMVRTAFLSQGMVRIFQFISKILYPPILQAICRSYSASWPVHRGPLSPRKT